MLDMASREFWNHVVDFGSLFSALFATFGSWAGCDKRDVLERERMPLLKTGRKVD